MQADRHGSANGEVKILTKGDHNPVDDRGLYNYNEGQSWLSRRDIVGKAKGFLPYLGMVTIIMNDYPSAKYAMIGSLLLFVLISREQQ